MFIKAVRTPNRLLVLLLIMMSVLTNVGIAQAASLNLSLTAGGQTTFVIDKDNNVYGWGLNDNYQLGDGTTTNRKVPTLGFNNSDIVQLASGEKHTLILTNNGKVYAFGANDVGQLGLGTTSASEATPQLIAALSGIFIVEISTYDNFSLALDNQGRVYSWGSNSYSQLGRTGDTTLPLQVTFPGGTAFPTQVVKSINAARATSYAVMADGTVAGWGDNFYRQVVNLAGYSTISTPNKIAGLTNISKVRGAWMGALALNVNGNVYSWGTNMFYILGQSGLNQAYGATQISGLSGVKDIVMGNTQAAILGSDKKVRAWGDYTRSGTTATSNFYTPTQIANVSGNTLAIAGGYWHVVLLQENGQVYGFGDNGKGQLGNNTTTSSKLPVLASQTFNLNLSPNVPSQLTASEVSPNSVKLSWQASTGYYPVNGYNIYRDGTLVGTSTTASYTATGLVANSSYSFTVRAKDSQNNLSPSSSAVAVQTLSTLLSAVPGPSKVQLSWNGIAGADSYSIKRALTAAGPFAEISNTNTTSYTDTGVIGGDTYYYKVSGFVGGVETGPSNTLTVTPLPPDLTPPSVPAGLAVQGRTTTAISLTWNASTDNVAVEGYEVYRDGVLAGSVMGTVYTVSNLSPGTSYQFTVKAVDSSGNVSNSSGILVGTTYDGLPNTIVIGGTSGLHAAPNTLDHWQNISPDSLNYDGIAVADDRLLAIGSRSAPNGGLVSYGYLGGAQGWQGPIETLDSNQINSQMPVYAAVYGNGKYVVAGGLRNGNLVTTAGFTSSDGIHFTQTINGFRNTTTNYTSGQSMGVVQDGAFGAGKFVLVGNVDNLNYTAYSATGSNWTIQLTPTALNYNAIAYGNGRFVAVGKYPSGSSMNPVISKSADGVTWSSTPQVLSTYANKQLKGIAYGNGTYVAVGTAGLILYSSDASNWTLGTSGTTYDLNAVAYDESTNSFIAVGSGGTVLVSATGAAWSASTVSPGGNLLRVAVYHGDLVQDHTAPVSAATISPVSPNGSNGWYNSAVSLSLSATDNYAGVDRIEYRLDSGSWTTYASVVSVTYSALHSLEYRSIDKAGNIENVQTTLFGIDTAVPSTAIEFNGAAAAENQTYDSSLIIDLWGSDSVSGVWRTEYMLDGGALTTYAGSIAGLSAGNHDLTYRTVDMAGNVEGWQSIHFTIN
ncbi:OmpL47-type beta-barrel domain-containing protein [Cohnella sp. GCM10020058]|uniref:OmpL47-type beta-barrel domain-containing protein n=1 Tax=Cohnella sp. GCM10020058 TaxID=3317330 RepID=UPI0036414D4C